MVLLVVLDGFGWFWVVPCFSNYDLLVRAYDLCVLVRDLGVLRYPV